jgi:hypothetical protein
MILWIWYQICMYVIPTIWKIQCVNRDEWWSTDVCVRTSVDRKGRTDGVGQNYDECWIERRRRSNGTATIIGLNKMATTIERNEMGMVVERNRMGIIVDRNKTTTLTERNRDSNGLQLQWHDDHNAGHKLCRDGV